jgi:hypothetical protein
MKPPFSVTVYDPATYLASVQTLATVALLACYVSGGPRDED